MTLRAALDEANETIAALNGGPASAPETSAVTTAEAPAEPDADEAAMVAAAELNAQNADAIEKSRAGMLSGTTPNLPPSESLPIADENPATGKL